MKGMININFILRFAYTEGEAAAADEMLQEWLAIGSRIEQMDTEDNLVGDQLHFSDLLRHMRAMEEVMRRMKATSG